MLAAASYPSLPLNFSSKDTAENSIRPSKDIESFNSLLPPPIEFIEGSSSGALAVPEGKYEPINGTPQVPIQPLKQNSPSLPPSPTKSSTIPSSSKVQKDLYPHEIDVSWPTTKTRVGTGLFNTGNTCFLNSALQCLLHTAPLLKILMTHTHCPLNGFCMICALKETAIVAHSKNKPFTPSLISQKLNAFAKHLRRGRQEDSHEFLRYGIDALQKASLGLKHKVDPTLAETTWVHKVFGGRLRSRVTCKSCGHNSDTFDSILDLSLDIHKIRYLKDAFRKFVQPDLLKGENKYKCEKCKKNVDAEKKFTVHQAPVVLTIHLKRFSPMGHKIGHLVQYDETINLSPYMSEGQYGPSYSLYGVICHAGGGPNSGHYIAYVKSRTGEWFEMDDESVTPIRSAPTEKTSAYILFYIRKKGERLESAVNSAAGPSHTPLVRKRKLPDVSAEDQGEKVSSSFIGPRLPPVESPPKRAKLSEDDPQASAIKQKISKATENPTTISNALSSLNDYQSDDEAAEAATLTESAKVDMSLPTDPVPAPYSTAKNATRPGPIPASVFYAKRNKSSGYNPYKFGKKYKSKPL